jgi:hypothetical protein
VNFDLGMRRGEVIENGDEAKLGAGEDILRVVKPYQELLRLSERFVYHFDLFGQVIGI